MISGLVNKKNGELLLVTISLVTFLFSGCSISVDQTNLDFGSVETQLTFNLDVKGRAKWSIECKDDWVTVNPKQGLTSSIITVTVDRTNLKSGSYTTILEIRKNNIPETLKITVKVAAITSTTSVNPKTTTTSVLPTTTTITTSIPSVTTTTVPYSTTTSVNWVVSEGEYIIIKAPPDFPSEYPGKIEAELPLFDKTYKALNEVTGFRPYDGIKIIVFYDPSCEDNYAWSGQIIRVGKGLWNEASGVIMAHELGHDFTLDFYLLFPSSPFFEGWAQFLRLYPFWVIDAKEWLPWVPEGISYPELADPYLWAKNTCENALNEYIQNGCKFENLSANAAAGILEEIVAEYGWGCITQLFTINNNINFKDYFIPLANGTTTANRCKIFVACINVATGNDITNQFKNYGFPVDSTEVGKYEEKIKELCF